MAKTIKFANSLPLDTAKFDIRIPYPVTSFYEILESEGRIKSQDWSKYICHQTGQPLFTHPNLDRKTIEYYYHQAFRDFYLRPSYIARRFIRSFLKGDLMADFLYFFRTRW